MQWLFAAAASAAPPDGVDPQDLARWEAGSTALLAGPPGCWELDGQITVTTTRYTPATRFSRGGRADRVSTGSFLGRLEGGRWTSFTYDLTPTDPAAGGTELDLPVIPTLGTIDPRVPARTNGPTNADSHVRVDMGQEQPMNLLGRVLDELRPDATTAYGEWDDARRQFVLVQDVPVSKRSRAEVVTLTTRFPEGGPATSLDAVFPRRLKLGDPPFRIQFFDVQAHLRGQVAGDAVLPALDTLSFGVGVLGFTVGYEQELAFSHATRCVGPEPPPAP